MSTHFKTIIFVVGVMLGIAAGETLMYASEVAVVAFVLGVVQIGLYKEQSEREPEGFALTLLTVLFSFGLFLGIIRVQLVEEKQNYVCESVCTFDATIISSSDVKDAYQQFTVHPVGADDDVLDIQVRTALYPRYQIGETVRLSGKVSVPDVIAPHGDKKSFDYAAYLLTRNVGSEMVYPKVDVLDAEPHTLTSLLGRWKESLIARMNMYVSSPEQSLASGMLFGANSMSQELTQTFRTAGLSHIIVLSGFNIMIVIASVLFVLRFLPLVLRIFLASVSVILFVMMVGGEASVIRATIMAFIGLLAVLVGREYVAKQALILSLFAIVMYEPYSLLHDVSLHLSFLATAGLVYMSESLGKYFARIPYDSLREMCTTTVAAYLFTLPYIMYTFGQVSVYALLANILVLPLVPFAMLLSFLVVVSSYFSHVISLVVGFLDTQLLTLIIFVAEMIQHLPFASFIFTISFPAMCCLYLIVISYMIYLSNKVADETKSTSQDGILSDVIPY
jgi:competence protein ComEC